MKDNSNIVKDNFVNSTTLLMHSGDATDSVPGIVKIFNSALGDVSSDFLDNDSLANIKVFKLARYVFPPEDPGPTIAGKTEVHDLHGLEYAVNLACHRLNLDFKSHWD